jgi:hypothetical protein
MSGVYAAGNPYRAMQVKAGLGRNCAGFSWKSATIMKACLGLSPSATPMGNFNRARRPVDSRQCPSAPIPRAQSAPGNGYRLPGGAGYGVRLRIGWSTHSQSCRGAWKTIEALRACCDPRFAVSHHACSEEAILLHLNGHKLGLKSCR